MKKEGNKKMPRPRQEIIEELRTEEISYLFSLVANRSRLLWLKFDEAVAYIPLHFREMIFPLVLVCFLA